VSPDLALSSPMAAFDEELLRRLAASARAVPGQPGAGDLWGPTSFRASAPLLGSYMAEGNSGFVLPTSASLESPFDYTGAYVTLDVYMPYSRPDFDIKPRDMSSTLARTQSRETLFLNLCLLNHIAVDEAKSESVLEGVRIALQPDLRVRLDNFLKSGAPGQHQFLVRQPILAALRHVVSMQEAGADSEIPSMLSAVFLSHAKATELAAERDTFETIADIPEPLFFELLRVSLLYEHDDMWSSIDRFIRLWRDFGSAIVRTPLRRAPADLLVEATGLEIEELLGLGFAQFAHDSQWEADKPPFMALDYGSDMDPRKLESFRQLMTATLDDYMSAYEAASDSRFDFLPFQAQPIWRSDHGLVSVDPGYLWDRVTSGLYWLVHDFEKSRSETDRLRWTQGYAEAVESLAESELRPLAPRLLDDGTAVITEDDFEAAYGQTKRCDFAIDFGSGGLLAEIVSGQLAIPTRVAGSKISFERDTKRLVIEKCEQVDAAGLALLNNSVPLLGYQVPTGYRICPVLVVGGGFPISPFTMKFVNEWLVREDLLTHPLFDPLCIVSLQELELLEGLGERGVNVLDVLRGWKTSRIANVPLRNFILSRHGGGRSLRPARIDGRVRATFDVIMKVLALRDPRAPNQSA
jgi:hypothetical protein